MRLNAENLKFNLSMNFLFRLKAEEAYNRYIQSEFVRLSALADLKAAKTSADKEVRVT
jgi:hypothetical protein